MSINYTIGRFFVSTRNGLIIVFTLIECAWLWLLQAIGAFSYLLKDYHYNVEDDTIYISVEETLWSVDQVYGTSLCNRCLTVGKEYNKHNGTEYTSWSSLGGAKINNFI